MANIGTAIESVVPNNAAFQIGDTGFSQQLKVLKAYAHGGPAGQTHRKRENRKENSEKSLRILSVNLEIVPFKR